MASGKENICFSRFGSYQHMDAVASAPHEHLLHSALLNYCEIILLMFSLFSLILWQGVCFKSWVKAFLSHFCLSFFISEIR